MPVYSLYLNTATTNANYKPSYSNTLAQQGWQINFDDLFRGDNLVYKNCRVRYQLISSPFSATSTEDSGTFGDYIGFLSISLPSAYQQNRGLNGSVLSMIFPQRVGDMNSTADQTCAYNVSTLNTTGVDISVPQGFQQLVINLYQDNSSQSLIRWTTEPTWSILLTFELY